MGGSVMNKIIKSIALFILTSMLSCCSSKVQVIHEDILDPVDIILSDKEKVLAVGETYQIDATYFIEEGNEQKVNFSYLSLNESVAIVSNAGLVEAVGIGEAIIRITYEKSKSLLKIIVKEKEESALLGLTIYDDFISLYEDDQYEFRYDAKLNGKTVDLTTVYSNYDNSIISINNNVITALNAGSTSAKISVTYGQMTAEKIFTVSVKQPTYYLACNYESTQVVVGEENLVVTYSLNFGPNFVRNIPLSELHPDISDEEVATINNGAIKGLKKGYFDLGVWYNVPENGATITSIDSFRCRERYSVKSIDLDETIYVLDGDKINYVPTNEDPNLVFDAWLKDGKEFDEPVESDLRLGVRWRINEFNFAQDVRGARSFAPSEGEHGETINAVYYNDNDIFKDGLRYDLSKNCHDGNATEDIIAYIYLPKMDYRKATKVTYFWKTNGYVTVDIDHWYGGALAMGGTIDVTYDGVTLTQTITQTYDISNPFSGRSYKNVSRTVSYNDQAVIQGLDNFQSISYWAYTDITTTSCIYLSNPNIYISHDYLPYIRLGNYIGTAFYTTDPNAHYDSDVKKPTIIQNVSASGNPNDDYLYYYQDRQYSEQMGYTHCRADYTLTVPAINFAKQDTAIIMPYNIEGGFYVGFDENKVSTDCTGQVHFEYKEATGLVISLRSENGELRYSYTCNDSNVINGVTGFSFPVCYSTHCFQRGLMLYQPRFVEKCTNHNYVISTEAIGVKVCSICGEVVDYHASLDEINFTVSTYGAEGGRWATYVQPTAKAMIFEITEGDAENVIKLPKINFNAFYNVVFNLSGNAWESRVGLETGSYAFPDNYNSGNPHSGVLGFMRHNGVLAVTLECPTGINQSLTIDDPEIMNGTKSVSIYMYSTTAYRTITAELIELD